jgi:hypothetical protein
LPTADGKAQMPRTFIRESNAITALFYSQIPHWGVPQTILTSPKLAHRTNQMSNTMKKNLVVDDTRRWNAWVWTRQKIWRSASRWWISTATVAAPTSPA